jgi:uncharacterized membrane protein YfcA
MGGGAVMTPLLVMFFGVAPLAAVSSDLVASLVMKPIGAAVHLRRGTVDTRLVTWLICGSVPAAFLGVVLLRSLGDDARVQHDVKLLLGLALLTSVGSMVAKSWIGRRRRSGGPDASDAATRVVVRPVRTVVIGVVGGLAVGMTSVGSGSLIIAFLLLAYPQLRAAALVGTDLVQAIPLVAAAALGHALFGDVQVSVTASLLVGALPGVYLGARLSVAAASRFVRPVLAAVLLASAARLLGLV